MSWLSKCLSGLCFDPEEFGIHVDSSGKVQDEELCLKNFEVCGKKIGSIWNQLVINDFPTFSNYRGPSDDVHFPMKSAEWMANHIRLSYYGFQYSKCDDFLSCKPRLSLIEQLLEATYFHRHREFFRTRVVKWS